MEEIEPSREMKNVARPAGPRSSRRTVGRGRGGEGVDNRRVSFLSFLSRALFIALFRRAARAAAIGRSIGRFNELVKRGRMRDDCVLYRIIQRAIERGRKFIRQSHGIPRART